MQSPMQWPSEGARRVPAAVYTDQELYEREQERIFRGRTWNYVGLAAEVPAPGDFIQSYVGSTPVVLVRDREGELRVFVNRCTHRNAQVCHEPRGHAKVFTCPYHQWSFGLDGRLIGIPFRRGINGKGGMSSCFKAEEHNLEQLRVAERHGVVFASFSHDVEPLEAYLGPTILAYFDRVCDGRPLRVIGSMRHRVEANWKLQVENLKDPFHAALLHSFFVTFGIWRSDQETEVKVDELGRSSVLVSTASFKRATQEAVEQRPAASGDFRLEDASIIAHQREYEHGTGAILTIWPNLIILQQLNCLAMRHVRPDGPDACVKSWTFFGYESDTPELLEKRLLQANMLGPSGLVTIDDNEVLAISQAGARSAPDSAAVLEAGEGTGSADHMLTESAIRAFYQYYQKIME
ncbi:aromatic ring-hydroxylating oxygenase subunit alpha [Chromobacterium piscinae]|uniref:Rieske 2Fe-2S domain-containing protein n=1 Tax=Chromobacterium piscinae TaxID=686831 RepID=A0ABV0H8F6_9NEIS|nr:Rieske 2Fe-2S domain-containing protein [Chromobacterium piscinae]MBX9296628.1 Rieske 2Fe-2S domain-containing protein [Chromobacterium vaccinii]MBX9359541.1 Rieske 2Fe-2S domain-containing protein [Chromobacterium vaccinii]MCD4504923.1 Rieske 2Fe-2S domain-containing protein [Chromobacterium piscinae]